MGRLKKPLSSKTYVANSTLMVLNQVSRILVLIVTVILKNSGTKNAKERSMLFFTVEIVDIKKVKREIL